MPADETDDRSLVEEAETCVPVRPYRASDSEDVVEFFRRAHSADPTVRPVSPETWRAFAGADFHEGGTGFFVAVDGEEVVALATSHLDPEEEPPVRHFRIVVEPDYRRQGLATLLLGRVLSLDEEKPELRLRVKCPDDWEAGRHFLESRHFELERSELQMERKPASVPEPEWPGSYHPEFPGPSDHDQLAEVHNEAYADSHSYSTLSGEGVERMLEYPEAELVAAERDGRTVGYCLTLREDNGKGGVESVAVHPGHQRRGVGRALLRTGMIRLRDRGLEPMVLSVDDDNRPALELYRSEGFRTVGAHHYYVADRTAVRRGD